MIFDRKLTCFDPSFNFNISKIFKKAHHKAKKNYNKYLNTKDEDKYRIVYTDKQALYESSTEEYTLQVEKFNQAQVWGFSEKKF